MDGWMDFKEGGKDGRMQVNRLADTETHETATNPVTACNFQIKSFSHVSATTLNSVNPTNPKL